MREIHAYKFSKLLTPSAKGSRWTQTLDHMMTWQVFYHCATAVGQIKNLYRILLSIMRLQVKCAPEFHIDFGKKLFLFFKNNFKSNNHCKLNHNKSHLKPFVSYLLCIVCTEYFSIIFNVKKCALYLIKYSISFYFFKKKGTHLSK